MQSAAEHRTTTQSSPSESIANNGEVLTCDNDWCSFNIHVKHDDDKERRVRARLLLDAHHRKCDDYYKKGALLVQPTYSQTSVTIRTTLQTDQEQEWRRAGLLRVNCQARDRFEKHQIRANLTFSAQFSKTTYQTTPGQNESFSSDSSHFTIHFIIFLCPKRKKLDVALD